MSLITVNLTPVRALVCVDTEGFAPGVGLIEVSKMVVLPHTNSLLAVRGLNAVLTLVYGFVTQAVPNDFDSVAKALPDFLKASIDWFKANLPPTQPDLVVGPQEIVWVGHCKKQDRMRCLTYVAAPDGEVSSNELEPHDSHYAPWTEAWGEPGPCDTPERMRFLATLQVDTAKAMHPDQPIGGRLLLAEVTKDEVCLSTLATL